ncbi:hypothetical protein G7092_11130 [Mucilaginibacter sp. HC2]|uniref:hypothetical protein n=1 Tax=Mucilaginibacter inviolabilis TaxID=2714892 RepID=UPI00140E8DD6|nr:hypothetical protein [Mucilaginibacter inviolabilis]NHA04354.1 hypothetical protein [Mucilaginibacter inviolabilis]
MKKILLSIALLCSLKEGHGQAIYSRVGKTTPPGPTATSLGVYGNYPVSDFRGVPAINIPLIDIELKKTNLPLSLSYDASGIKVDQIASWVGLGWSLNCGGVVTRSVVNIADDCNHTIDYNTGMLHYNYYQPGFVNPPPPTFAVAKLDINTTQPEKMSADVNLIRNFGFDTEPDIFCFNFNGRAGKFILKPKDDNVTGPNGRQVLMIPYQDLKIEYSMAQDGYGGEDNNYGSITQFIITDTNGDRYYFDVPEKLFMHVFGKLVGTPEDPVQGVDLGAFNVDPYDITDQESGGGTASVSSDYYQSQGPIYTSSWYLSKIVTAQKDTVNFTYADETYIYDLANNTQAINSPINLSDADGCNIKPTDFNNGVDFGQERVTSHVFGKRLTAIEGTSFKITFTGENARPDVNGMNSLDYIDVYSKSNGQLNPNPIKEFHLIYHVMADLTKPQKVFDGDTVNAAKYGDSRLHLLLNTLSVGGNSGTPISYYSFGYNETIPLPDRFSYQKDFWGYFNNNSCSTPIPKLYIYPNASTEDGGPVENQYSIFKQDHWGSELVLPGADRNTNAAAILSGTLKSITFPTGGYTQFTFEPHTFNYNGHNITGGGLRLKQSVAYDGVNHANDIIKTYSYLNSSDNVNSSGVLFNMPIFAYNEMITHYDDGTINTYQRNTMRSDISNSVLSGFDGVNVGYREITETLADNSKTIRKYSVPGGFGILGDYSINGCLVDQSGSCDGLFTAVAPMPLQVYGNDIYNPNSPAVLFSLLNTGDEGVPNTFPFAPNTNYDWNRGLLLDETFFNASGTKLKEHAFQYQLFTPKNTGPVWVRGLKRGRLRNYAFFHQANPGVNYTAGIPHYNVIAEYQTITQVAKVPSSETVTEFYTNNNVTTSKSYTYNYNSLNPNVEESDQSNGKHWVTHRTFVKDIDLSQSSSQVDYLGYQNMFSNNINSLVESYTQQRNADNSLSTVSGTVITYKPDLPVPSMSYVFHTNMAVPNFTQAVVSTSGISKDAHYDLDQSLDQYDTGNNIEQVTNKGVSSNAYQWGYNKQYQTVQVSNALKKNIFYTGFEEGDGNTASGDAKTGHYSFNNASGYSKVLTGIDNGTYKLSYWQKNGGNWVLQTLFNIAVTNNTYTINLSGQIDDVRFYPAGAQMTTYTYDPLVGMTSMTDTKNEIVYYEYDSFQRLINVKDKDGNIIKHTDYHYQGQ